MSAPRLVDRQGFAFREVLGLCSGGDGENAMISTHILDTSLGHPAAGVPVELARKSGSEWQTVATDKTNADGRIAFSAAFEKGSYRLLFQTEDYLRKNGGQIFFPAVQVEFVITDTARKYHVPLLLNPYGYSTYRGS